MKKRFILSLVIGLFLSSLGSAFAEDPSPQKGVKPQPQLRKEIIKLKFINAADAQALLRSYRSQYTFIDVARDANKNEMLIIRDTPENFDKILALIKEVDIKPAELLFTVQLILGSESGEEKTDESLKNDPVIKEIRNLLKYKSFTLIDSNLVRTIEREPSQVTMGRKGQYILYLKPKYIRDEKEENIQTEIQFGYYFQGQERMNLIQSTLIMKPGEKTVVGVSKPQGTENVDKGLILIISGRLLK
jgi:hypothetical protein